MVEPISFGIAIGYLVKSAPAWLQSLQETILNKSKELALDQSTKYLGRFIDEKKYLRHIELALKNASERGLRQFNTPIERDQYRSVLQLLSETNNEALRREAMSLFTLSDDPDLAML